MKRFIAAARGRAALLCAVVSFSTLFGSVLADTMTYVYDGDGRLKQAVLNDGTTVNYSLDPAGNRLSTSVNDTTAPSVPTNLAGTVVSATRIDLTWTASTDTGISGLAGYRVFRNGSQIATSPTASYSDTTVVGSTTYTYAVAAYDNGGNVSAQSAPITRSTPDITPPSVPTGLDGGAPSSTQVNLTWSASTDTGGSGLAGYKVFRNGTQIGTSTTTSYADTTAVLGSTTYSYTVAAYDNATNTSAQSAPKTITTPDTIKPVKVAGVLISAPSSNQVSLSWSPSSDTGGSGLAGYRIYRVGTSGPIGTTTGTSYADTSVVGTTSYTYTITAYDNALNESVASDPAAITTPDTIAPSIPTSLGGSAASGSQVNLSWAPSTDTGGSGLAGYKVYRGGSSPIGTATGTSYSDTTTVASSSYTYTVAAYDNAGNNSSASSGVTVNTPDDAPPSVPTSLSGSSNADGTAVTLTWAASTDNPGGSGVAGYKILRGGSQIGTSATTSYTDSTVTTATTYQYSVQSYDNIGNTSSPSGQVPVTTPTFIQITDPTTGAVIPAASALYATNTVCSTFTPCTLFLKQKYGSQATVWSILLVGATCGVGVNTTTTPGYRRILSTCRIEATSTTYGH